MMVCAATIIKNGKNHEGLCYNC